jgi:hypothetical protein
LLGVRKCHHTDPATTNEHYNRAASLNAAQRFAVLIKRVRAG